MTSPTDDDMRRARELVSEHNGYPGISDIATAIAEARAEALEDAAGRLDCGKAGCDCFSAKCAATLRALAKGGA